MQNDPHESGLRQAVFRKDEYLEAYFDRLNRHLAGFEVEGIPGGEKYPVIYVVGLPRSGTTLLSQLISRCLPVGYINNLIARFWRNPVVGIRLSQAAFGPDIREKINLSSTHGVTTDPWGPHEFGYFWRHWLKLDEARTHKLPADILARVERTGLRQALDRMAGAFGAPLIFKNIICGFQASFLNEVRPNSLFVLIERDPQAVAVSLLRSRKERYGDASVWWSLKPSTYEEICNIKSQEVQIERQIVDGARDFQEELAKPGVNSIRLSYEALCANPVKSLEMIASATESFGYPMSILESPPQLTASRT
jgi:hypothetical protein